MPRKPKMPKYVGLLVHRGAGFASARRGYSISLTICPEDIGLSCDATNAEMVEAVIEAVKQGAIKRERKAIANAMRAARGRPYSQWEMYFADKFISGAELRNTNAQDDQDLRWVCLTDWIERGLYRSNTITAEDLEATRFNLSRILSMPKTKSQPAYDIDGDVFGYVRTVVSIAAAEGAATAPPGTQAYMLMRPLGEEAWHNCGLVADLTDNKVANAMDEWHDGADNCQYDIDIAWLADAESGKETP